MHIHNFRARSCLKFVLLPLVVALPLPGNTEEQTKTYIYDALGRVTFVQDDANGHRDYDYDPAGNRCATHVGTANDAERNCTSPPQPSVPGEPTGLSVRGPFSQFGGYSFSWRAVPGALFYEVYLRDGRTITTSRTSSQSDGPRPKWVRAVNDVGPGLYTRF